MSKYIEQSKVNDEIVRVLEHTDCKDEHIDRVLMAIEKIPTIEIVHCKGCKHRYDDGWLEPRWTCKYKDMRLKDNDFCSYGERIEE